MLGVEFGFLPFGKYIALCLDVWKNWNWNWNWNCDVSYDFIMNRNLKRCNGNVNVRKIVIKEGINVVGNIIVILQNVTWVKNNVVCLWI
jgi:hypothetical protein